MNLPEPTPDEAALRAAGQSLVNRLLGSRIAVVGTTEGGDLLLGAMRPDGSVIEVIIAVENGELVLCEVVQDEEAP